MNEIHDLELLVRSRTALVLIETREESRALELVTRTGQSLYQPVFRWSITEGLQRWDIESPPQKFNSEPREVLGHIRGSRQEGIYVLLDFHPFLDDPLNVRMLKDISLAHADRKQTLVLISHELSLPPELASFSSRFDLQLPGEQELAGLVREQARSWAELNPGKRVRTDEATFKELVRNLAGLSVADAKRLARRVIFDDGAITAEDLPEVMEAKYRLLNREGVLAYEYDTASFNEVGGLSALKAWLERRRPVFLQSDTAAEGLDPPRGVLLLGVQGGGKSLAARAVAGCWGVPLLRLDFGSLYDKFHGETERNLRESLGTAQVMSPCVLWIDEIEKGVAGDAHDGGTSRRVLGTLLTWMAESRKRVFLVATANDITRLPPELIRKGRMDEIFFVDLPNAETRKQIFTIHLDKRGQEVSGFDLTELASATEGFSGAEIEQVVVSALYAATEPGLNDSMLVQEASRTRPLSVVMAENIAQLRHWASERTVSAG